jgi:hypothetical protein
MILALKRYENNPRRLKFIFFFEHFLSMEVSTIIVKLEKEKTFYKKILVKLDTNTDQKFIVYIKSILDNIKTCSKAWKDINKVGCASKTIKEKTMLDLIKESKDNSKLPYDAKLNYKTPIFLNINEYTKEIDEDTFYGPTKDEILESLQHGNTINSSNVTIVNNLESDKAAEIVLSYAKEVVLPSDEIFERLPIKSFEEINEHNGGNEHVATMITNLEPRKNVDKQQEQIIKQISIMKHSPLNPSCNEENQFKNLIENYYKFMFPEKDLCDYQEEFSLSSLPVDNSLENLTQPKSTNEVYKNSGLTTNKYEQNSLFKNPLPCTSNDEQKLSYSNSPPSISKDQGFIWPISPSTKSTNSCSYRPINIPTYNREEDLYYSSDSLSSNESSLSKKHSDVELDKFSPPTSCNVHSEQIPSNTLRQNNMVCRRSNSGPINSIRNRNANRVNSKNKSNRKRSNSLPCLSCGDKILPYYNLPHEKNEFYDSALGISLDTSYDYTPEDCLFDLYVDSDQTERYNAVSLLNTWIDIKNLDPDCDINVEDDNQTINNDSNDSEIWSETIDKEDDKGNLVTHVNINLEEIEDIQDKQADESVPYKQSETNESHNTEINDQNLNVLKPEDDKNFKVKNTQNESYGSEVTAIDESIIQNNLCNLATTNCNILTTTDATKLNNTKVLELNSVKDLSVTSAGRDSQSESSAANVDDRKFKGIEVLAQVDTFDLQLSATIVNSNLTKPVSANKRSLETTPPNKHDLDDSKEKEVSKLNPESVNSTNDIISEVSGDVANQLDMSILKNAQQAEISPEKSTEQVINSHPNVSKNANSHSNVSRDEKVPSKISNDANLTLKVSNDVNLLSNISKDNNLPSKSSDGTKNINSNIGKQISKKTLTENKSQANSNSSVDKQNSGLSNQKAKNLQSNNQNATKSDEKVKNKPPGIRISFGFSRSDNILQRSRRT